MDSHRDYRAIRALVPADQIEILAASPSVSFIGRKVGSLTSRLKVAAPVHSATKAGLAPGFEERAARVRKQIAAYLQQQAGANSTGVAHGTGQGNVTTEGDAAHTSATARGVYGVSGVGLKIGVLSDSANNTGAVTTAQATGDMPPTCPGPGGPCLTILQDDPSGGSDEGAAMLEIVYDMAPGANLYFATADISESGFASNILALQTAGCNIIVDDVFYFDEPVFQDGIVAQAVTTVTGLGVNYFSSAGNEGNVAKNTAGYFEGDFNDNGSAAFTFPGGTKTGTIHNFGTVATPVNGDIITSTGEAYTLNWADPQGTSANDYDLFLVTSAGTVKSSSTNIQNGTQNPFEQITPPALVAGDRLVVFKVTGAASVAFAINTLRGTLDYRHHRPDARPLICHCGVFRCRRACRRCIQRRCSCRPIPERIHYCKSSRAFHFRRPAPHVLYCQRNPNHSRQFAIRHKRRTGSRQAGHYRRRRRQHHPPW